MINNIIIIDCTWAYVPEVRNFNGQIFVGEILITKKLVLLIYLMYVELYVQCVPENVLTGSHSIKN